MKIIIYLSYVSYVSNDKCRATAGGRREGKGREGIALEIVRKAGIRSGVREEKGGKVGNRWRDGKAELSISKKRKEEEEEDRDGEIWVSRPWG